jgi:hypothetical protein
VTARGVRAMRGRRKRISILVRGGQCQRGLSLSTLERR